MAGPPVYDPVVTEQTPARAHRVTRITGAVAAGLALVLTVGSAVGWSAVNRLAGNLTVDQGLTELLDPAEGTSAEPVDPGTGFKAANILVVGSDTRTGQGAGYGGEASSSGNGSSDTTILLHISADRKFAYGISIPRDSWVTRPSCETDGSTDGTLTTDKFNTAYAVGGRKCMVRAVKYLTGVPIDHFVEVDFKGFKKIVDALGGVTICTTRTLSDPKRQDSAGNWHGSGLYLTKGTHTLTGDDAVAFVRSRSVGGNADLGRMDRQQAFVSSIIRSATSSGLLTDLPRLYSVLDAVTSSLTVDAGLSGDALKSFLLSMQGMSPSDITFATVPWKARGDGENVLWIPSKSNPIWQAMKDDTRWPVATSKPAGSKPLTVAPADITLEIVDASGAGLGKKAAKQLRKQGFTVSEVTTAQTSSATTSVAYAKGDTEAARSLAFAAGVTAPAAASLPSGSNLELTVGSDWTKAATVTIAPKSGTGTSTRSAADKSCIG